MRKNRSKHEAKKPRLAKRALALCFALIFVCSCLLPAFAYGDVATFEADGGAALLDGGFAVDDSYGVDVQDETTDASTDTATTQPGGISTGVGGGINMGGSVVIGGDSTTDTTDNPYKANVTTDKDGNVIYTWDVDKIDLPEDATITRPDEDHALDKVDAAFSLPTNIYHFWLKEMSSYDLEEVSSDAKAADMTVEQYLAMYGKDKGCYHIMTAADGADLNAYKFSNPTSLDDADGRTFAGWYTIDEFQQKHDFTFDQTLYITSGTTVEVFAKWITPVEKTTNINAESVTVTVDGVADAAEVDVAQSENESFYDEIYNDLADDLSVDEDGNSKYKSVDIHMFNVTPLDKNYKAVQPASGKKATVTIEGMSLTSDEFKVYHWKDGEIEDLTSTAKLENGTLTFKTSSFSDFAVVGLGASAAEQPDRGGGSRTGSWVYLYAAFEDNNIQDYTPSGSDWGGKHWVTIGKVWVQDIANLSYISRADGVHRTSGTNYNYVISALNQYKDSVDTTKFERFEANKNISIDDITWNKQELFEGNNLYGLSQGNGANSYVSAGTITWHFDGYVQNVGAYQINYLEKGTNKKLRDSYTNFGTQGQIIYASDFDNSKAPITTGGKTYNYVESDPVSVRIVKGDTVVINIYYTREIGTDEIPTEDQSFIIVEKRFEGLTEATVPSDFQIKVKGDTTKMLNWTNTLSKQQEGNAYVVRWKVTGVNAGAYTITESGYEKTGYEAEAKITGTSEAFDPTAGKNVTVTVPTLSDFSATVITEKNNPSYSVAMSNTQNTIFVGRLTGNVGSGLIVFTAEPLSYAQREAIKNVLGTYKMSQGGTWGGPNVKVYFYSVKEQLESGKSFEIGGSQVTYSNNKITFSDQGIWNMVATATYSTTDAQNPEISITNTYSSNTASVTITKETTGFFADRTKAFKFTVDLSADAKVDDTTGKRFTFNLANGNSKTIEDLTVGTIFTVAEDENDSKDYETTATGHEEKAKSFKYQVCVDGEGNIYLQALDASGNAIDGKTITGKSLGITVNNHFDGDPDTGVLLDTLPYLIILGIAVAGAAALLIRKKKHDDE